MLLASNSERLVKNFKYHNLKSFQEMLDIFCGHLLLPE